MKREKNTNVSKYDYQIRNIKLRFNTDFNEKCQESETCPYRLVCPKCKHRICNANSVCCKTCTEGMICPMRGIK